MVIVLCPALRYRRAEQPVLPPAGQARLSPVARDRPRRLRVLRQGEPVSHAPATIARAPRDRLLRRVAPLGPTLGPILFQLPPQLHADLAKLRAFLRALGRQPHLRDLRAVLEVRHASWLVP